MQTQAWPSDITGKVPGHVQHLLIADMWPFPIPTSVEEMRTDQISQSEND